MDQAISQTSGPPKHTEFYKTDAKKLTKSYETKNKKINLKTVMFMLDN